MRAKKEDGIRRSAVSGQRSDEKTQNSKFKIQSSTLLTHNSKLLTLSLLLTAYCFLLFPGCSRPDRMFKESRVLMDTFCAITVVSQSEEKAKEAIEAGFAEIKKLDKYLNNFSPDSEISSISKSAGIKPVRVSKETLDIIQKTIGVSDMTAGAFDPTIAPVLKLWKFSGRPANPSIPSADAIDKARKLVDYKKIKTDGAASEIYLQEKGMELDLGGIAKGYAADKAVEVIKAKGIKAALVAIAGDIRGYGLSATGTPWKVGIQDPRPENPDSEKPWEDIFASVHLKDSAISTAGDYQRFFMKDGKRYHHIIDPKTGCPSESGLISVSVIAPHGYIADGIDTAVLVLGAEKGLKLLESMNIDGILVDSQKRVVITSGLKGKIEILHKGYQVYLAEKSSP
ncbi:MAG: FAD:protein FMN transferase [Nitrospiraceae bacterium]|nr:MAG: FAD:protein FMN transferase [Nitrospiraceae bacterium]